MTTTVPLGPFILTRIYKTTFIKLYSLLLHHLNEILFFSDPFIHACQFQNDHPNGCVHVSVHDELVYGVHYSTFTGKICDNYLQNTVEPISRGHSGKRPLVNLYLNANLLISTPDNRQPLF